MLKTGFVMGVAVGAAIGMCVAATCPKVSSAVRRFKRQAKNAVSEKCDECKQAVEDMANMQFAQYDHQQPDNKSL